METKGPFLPLDNAESEANNAVVTPKTIRPLTSFVLALKEIHVRLIAEGYIVKDGQLIKSEKLLRYEKDNKPPRKDRY